MSKRKYIKQKVVIIEKRDYIVCQNVIINVKRDYILLKRDNIYIITNICQKIYL